MHFKLAQLFGMSSYIHKNDTFEKSNIWPFKCRADHSFMILRCENIFLWILKKNHEIFMDDHSEIIVQTFTKFLNFEIR